LIAQPLFLSGFLNLWEILRSLPALEHAVVAHVANAAVAEFNDAGEALRPSL
jgi:hypothetical protein